MSRDDQRNLRGNSLLRLDDPRSMWIVETGSVGLFSVALEGDEPIGPRRFFFRCEAGAALFGFPTGRDPGERSMVAVALEDSVLRRAPLGNLDSGDGARRLAEWVAGWQRVVGPRTEPLTLQEPGQLEGFHEDLLRRIQRLEGAENEAEHARLRERERHSVRAAQEAVGELTSVLEPVAARRVDGSDLFVAAAAVGHELGIEMRPPSAWEQRTRLADPVDMLARASHVRMRRVGLHEGWWHEDCGPMLAFLGEDRSPVAVLPSGDGIYVWFDPRTRERRRVDAEAAAELDQEACVFYRTLPEQAYRASELIRFALRGRAGDLLLILATASAATLLGMVTPMATALLVDFAIPDANGMMLVQLGFALFAAACGAAIFRFSQGIAMLRLETGADAATQSAVWDRLLNLQLSFFRRFSTGDLQSRVMAISQIRAYLSGTTLRTLFSSVILLLNLALLLYYSPLLAIVALAIATISASTTVISGALILRCSREILELRGKFFGLMVQLINGIAKLRVAAAEERAFARWAGEYARLLRLGLRQRRIQDNVQLINIAVSTLGTVLLFAAAATLVREASGSLTTGLFLAFNAAYGTFIGAIVSLSNTVTDVLAIAILRERARPILEAIPEIDEHKTDPGELNGRVELERIAFRYTHDGPLVLSEVSLRAAAGEFIALVGPSGSGKSTVLRMLLGLETPDSGVILYDGQDLSGLDVFAVRRQLGVVLQNGRINAGSMFENIACSARISLNDAWDAARAVGFGDDIKSMPMGMHTVISEGGTNLSGGQRQRLLLSRALVHRPRMLLLDEATSALDNRTQAIVSQSLEGLDVTRIVVAHRLSTIRRADRIYVIEAGRVVEQGSFDVLSKQDGLFARLIERQLA